MRDVCVCKLTRGPFEHLKINQSEQIQIRGGKLFNFVTAAGNIFSWFFLHWRAGQIPNFTSDRPSLRIWRVSILNSIETTHLNVVF